jgi:hypothetical protein
MFTRAVKRDLSPLGIIEHQVLDNYLPPPTLKCRAPRSFSEVGSPRVGGFKLLESVQHRMLDILGVL